MEKKTADSGGHCLALRTLHFWLRKLQNLGTLQPDWNRILQPFDQSALLYTEDLLAASHCGSAPAKLCRWRCDVWSKAGDKRCTSAACEQIRWGCLQEKVLPSLQRGKDTLVQSQRNWLPMRHSEGGGKEVGKEKEGVIEGVRGSD